MAVRADALIRIEQRNGRIDRAMQPEKSVRCGYYVFPDRTEDAVLRARALTPTGESAEDCIAIEDNAGGVQSATSAGVSVVAFPNENTVGHTFERASGRVDRLDFAELRSLTASA